MSLWRRTRLLALFQITTLNANIATLDQIKEVFRGETNKINLKLVTWIEIFVINYNLIILLVPLPLWVSFFLLKQT